MAKLLALVFLPLYYLSSYSAFQAKKCIDMPDAIKEQRYLEFDLFYRKYMEEASKKYI
jgi:hypothetical protein